MATTLINSTSGSVASNGPGALNLNITKPSGTTTGDLMVAFGWSNGGNSGPGSNNLTCTIQPLAGWDGGFQAVVPTGSGGSIFFYHGIHFFYKNATASEPSSYNFTVSEGNNFGLGYGAMMYMTTWRGRPAYPYMLQAGNNQTFYGNPSGTNLNAPIGAQPAAGRLFYINLATNQGIYQPSPSMTNLLGTTFSTGSFSMGVVASTLTPNKHGSSTETIAPSGGDVPTTGFAIGTYQIFDPEASLSD